MNEMSGEAKLLRNLKDAGFDEDTIQRFLELKKDGRIGEQRRLLSVEFARFFIARHVCDEQFIKMARVMGIPNADKAKDFITALVQLQKECGVDNLKMSDYGFEKSESMTLAVNARETMGGLFLSNPCPMSDEECAAVLINHTVNRKGYFMKKFCFAF